MHSSTPKKILAVVCSFLLSLLAFLLLVAICTKMTFFDKGFYLSNIAKTHYYEKVTSDLMEDFTSLGIPGGIPDEVFKNTISQDDVQTEIMACIDTSFSGKTYQIRSNAVKQKLYSAFLDYAKQQHKREATDQEQQALQELASECEKVYIQNVRFPFIYPGRHHPGGALRPAGCGHLVYPALAPPRDPPVCLRGRGLFADGNPFSAVHADLGPL